MPTIFDFDLTLTKDHTFKTRHLEMPYHESQYQTVGKEEAPSNIKNGISKIFNHDQNEVCAIATFHNNPYYIAGYVSFLLKKEVELSHITHQPDNPNVAIAHYRVEGSSQHFLISYIDATGMAFRKAITELANKNAQIAFLRQTWIEQGAVARNDAIDFYDDEPKNYKAAAKLPYVDRYLVTRAEEHTISKEQVDPDDLPVDHTANEKTLEKQLVVLRKKITLLKSNKHEQAAVEAEKLYHRLFNAFDTYTWNVEYDLDDFKRDCKKAIGLAHVELDQHRGWKNFLSNLALFIFGLGVGLIVKEIVNVVNNRPFLFFTKTESAQLLDEISTNMDEMRPENP